MNNDKTCMCWVWKNCLNYVNENEFRLCESDIENMDWKNVVVNNDIIYERRKGECGIIMRFKGDEKAVLYFVKCSIFKQCEDSEEKFNNEDEIIQWGDGKYYKRLKLGSEKSLRNIFEENIMKI